MVVTHLRRGQAQDRSTLGGRSTLRRISVAALLIGSLSLWGAATASAHDALVSSSPSKGESVNEVTEVSLEFSAELASVDGAETSAIEVTGPGDSKERFDRSTPTIDGKHATVPTALGAAGTYLVTWRVVSSDGHPISGKFTFDYVGGNGVVSPEPTPDGSGDTPTANDTPAPNETPKAGDPSKDDPATPDDSSTKPTPVSPSTAPVAESDSKTNPWLIVGGSIAGLAVIVGAIGALMVSKRRREDAFKTDHNTDDDNNDHTAA